MGKTFKSTTAGMLLLIAASATALAEDLVATRQGLMCVSPDALAKLTLPDGSSKVARPDPSPSDLALKRDGGCIDIKIGARISVTSARRNTSLATYVVNGGSQTYIVPNIDFQPVRVAASETPTVVQYVTAPGGKTTYYIMSLPSRNSDGDPNMQIEAMYNNNSSSSVLLFNRSSPDPEKNLTQFSKLTLSPDSKTLYFQTEAWATSNAIHSINIATKQVSFVAPGGITCIVLAGQYQGDLVVEQHRYFAQGGSYDSLWLLSPSGKEIGPVSQNTDVPKNCATLGN